MYTFRHIQKEDITSIMHWRNEQMDILRQKKAITESEQHIYYEQFVFPQYKLEQPNLLIYSILQNEKLIGYGGLVHINWEVLTAEISFLLETSLNNNIENFNEIFFEFLCFLKPIAFEKLLLKKIYTSAYDIRPNLYEILDKHNFTFEARIKDSVSINGKIVDEVRHSYTSSQFLNKIPLFNILITSISSKVPLVNDVKSACKKFKDKILVFGSDSNDNIIAKHFVDHFWNCKPLKELSLADISNYCKINNIKLIIPTRNAELLFYSENKFYFQNKGITVLISDSSTVECCIDKIKFYEFCKVKNIPAIPTFHEINSQYKKWVVKNRFGAGSKDVFLNINTYDAIEYSKNIEQPIFQPFCMGKEISIDCYYSLKSVLMGFVIRERVNVENGESKITISIVNSELTSKFKKIASNFNFIGPVVFQAFYDGNDLQLIECNPRFGGASSASIKSGLDTFYWAIAETGNMDITKFQFYTNKSSLKQVRFSSDLIIDL